MEKQNETPFKNQKDFDDYINRTAQNMKKDLNLNDDARFFIDTIEQPVYYYIDETTGEKIYDTEAMLEEFQDKLYQL